MATVNVVDLLEESLFRSADQVLLPEDLVVKTQAEEQGEDSSKEEEGTESLESRELSKQIDSHVVVSDDDNPRTTSTMLSSDTA